MGAHNNWPYIINLGNSIIGVAVLAMPFCFKQCGILLGMLVLLFCTWLTLSSCQLLMKAGIESRRRSYEFLALHTHGAAGKMMSELGMIGMQLGTLIAQIVVIGDLGPAIISKWFYIENTQGLRTFLIMVLCLSVGLPLGLLKNLRTISRASTICISFYCVFVVYVVCMSLPNLWSGAWYPYVNFWRPQGLFQCLPILSFSFGCQTQLFMIYDALPEPSLKAMNGVISSAVNLCAVAYLLTGFFGYIAFYAMEDIPGNVIGIFPSTIAADMCRLCFVFSIVITFPVIIFPCRASIYTMLFAKKSKPFEEVIESDGYIPENLFKLITVLIVLGSMITGILIPNVEFILGMNGAITGTLICYIFPALFFMKVRGKNPDQSNVAKAVLVLGISILVVSTYATLSSQEAHQTKEMVYDSKDGLREVPLGVDVPHVVDGQIVKPEEGGKADGEVVGDDVKKEIEDSVVVKNDVQDEIRKEPPIPNPPDSDIIEDKKDYAVKKKVEDPEETKGLVKKDAAGPLKLNDSASLVKKGDSDIDKKRDIVLAKLEEQQKEQQKILEEQREVLHELKIHHEKDVEKDLMIKEQEENLQEANLHEAEGINIKQINEVPDTLHNSLVKDHKALAPPPNLQEAQDTLKVVKPEDDRVPILPNQIILDKAEKKDNKDQVIIIPKKIIGESEIKDDRVLAVPNKIILDKKVPIIPNIKVLDKPESNDDQMLHAQKQVPKYVKQVLAVDDKIDDNIQDDLKLRGKRDVQVLKAGLVTDTPEINNSLLKLQPVQNSQNVSIIGSSLVEPHNDENDEDVLDQSKQNPLVTGKIADGLVAKKARNIEMRRR